MTSHETMTVHSTFASADPAETLEWLYPRLRVTARSLVGGEGVDDLVHEALVRVLTVHPGFRGLTHPLAYCRTIMLRIVASTEGRGRAAAHELSPGISERLESTAGSDVALRLTLEAALKGLGPRQRSCVYLRFLCGLTDREAAQVLGCGASSVRSQTARGLKTLRATLADLE